MPNALMGDMNVNLGSDGDWLSRFMLRNGYRSLVSSYTTSHFTTLDSVFVRNIEAAAKVMESPFSYHKQILLLLEPENEF